jgi:hypothetical protein
MGISVLREAPVFIFGVEETMEIEAAVHLKR